MPATKVWVLWHRYLDGSGAHIERTYFDKQRADEDLALLRAAQEVGGSGGWTIAELEGEAPSPFQRVAAQ